MGDAHPTESEVVAMSLTPITRLETIIAEILGEVRGLRADLNAVLALALVKKSAKEGQR